MIFNRLDNFVGCGANRHFLKVFCSHLHYGYIRFSKALFVCSAIDHFESPVNRCGLGKEGMYSDQYLTRVLTQKGSCLKVRVRT